MQTLLNDSDTLLSTCGCDYEDTTEYELFIRCLSEQTIVENEKRRLRTKEDGTMNSTALQNPSIRKQLSVQKPEKITGDMWQIWKSLLAKMAL